MLQCGRRRLPRGAWLAATLEVGFLLVWVSAAAGGNQGGKTAAAEPADLGAETCAGGAGCDDHGPAKRSAELPEVEPPFGDEEYPRYPLQPQAGSSRVWSDVELALHSGADMSRPLLLAILGEVFDVGPGKRFYGPGQGYGTFSGHDRSRAFADMGVNGTDEELSRVEDLPPEKVAAVFDWRRFYRDHAGYRFVGLLAGRYWTPGGRATGEGNRLEERGGAAAAALAERKELQKRFKRCNNKFIQAESSFEVSCTDGYHLPGSTPVHLYVRTDEDGARSDAEEGAPAEPKEEGWCACVPPADVAVQGGLTPIESGALRWRLRAYPECNGQGQKCRRPKGSPLP